MELTLNLVWVALAVGMLLAWVRYAPREGVPGRVDWRVQLVALGLVILILLPAISLTDDLTAARNPAEVDTYLRRDHDWLHPHLLIPAAAALLIPLFAALSLGAVEFISRVAPLVAMTDAALNPIENRPPPSA